MSIKDMNQALSNISEAMVTHGPRTTGLALSIKRSITLFSTVPTNTFLLSLFFAANAHAAPQDANTTLCHADESVIFSCPLENKKTISVCASKDLSDFAGFLQYRYGEIDKNPELIYPNSKRHPSLSFQFDSSHGGQWARYQLEFDEEEHLHQILVQTNSAILDNSGILVVIKNKKAVTNTDCDFKKATNRFWLLENKNIPPLR